MKHRIFVLAMSMFLLSFAKAQEVNPIAQYNDAEGSLVETTSIDDGEAPLEVTFLANPSNMEGHTPSYEWHFQKTDLATGEKTTLFVRYEENTVYRFVESGQFDVVLKVNFANEELEIDSTSIRVVISESKLEFPNAFSPNGDGINDIYKAKEGYKSIVEFHAYIFNRWGQKLYDWTDLAGGWDGKFNGKDVADGVYFVLVKAKGADGHKYNIRKDVNLLRGYIEGTTSTSSQ